MQCPQCGHQQASTVECESCGVIFSKWKPHELAEPEGLPSPLETLFSGANVLRLQENPRGLLSILTGWTVAREFDVVDSIGRQRGSVAQRVRWGSTDFAVFSYPTQQLVMSLHRPWFFLFSEVAADGIHGERLGSAKRRFSVLQKRYELSDRSGQIFATITSPILHPWTFQIFDRSGQQRAEIAKKWAGTTEEMVTGAQRFRIDFMNHDWPLAQRAVILAAALSIDFDSFESTRNRPSLIGALTR